MENKSIEEPKAPTFDHLRNMLLPVKDDDVLVVKWFKNSVFYFTAVMMILTTFIVFSAVLIAA